MDDEDSERVKAIVLELQRRLWQQQANPILCSPAMIVELQERVWGAEDSHSLLFRVSPPRSAPPSPPPPPRPAAAASADAAHAASERKVRTAKSKPEGVARKSWFRFPAPLPAMQGGSKDDRSPAPAPDLDPPVATSRHCAGAASGAESERKEEPVKMKLRVRGLTAWVSKRLRPPSSPPPPQQGSSPTLETATHDWESCAHPPLVAVANAGNEWEHAGDAGATAATGCIQQTWRTVKGLENKPAPGTVADAVQGATYWRVTNLGGCGWRPAVTEFKMLGSVGGELRSYAEVISSGYNDSDSGGAYATHGAECSVKGTGKWRPHIHAPKAREVWIGLRFPRPTVVREDRKSVV